MDLFSNDTITNLLPYDGIVNYHGKTFNNKEAQHYLDTLLQTIAWKNDEVIIFGKRIVTKRKTVWYGEPGLSYTYSGIARKALPWIKELQEIKTIVEKISNTRFNSCLLNLYHNGDEGMSWHSDDEPELGKENIIASVSFGAERKFSFKHKQTKQTLSVMLENGSVLIMKGSTQANWLHCLPKTKKITKPRINLTFRTIIDQ